MLLISGWCCFTARAWLCAEPFSLLQGGASCLAVLSFSFTIILFWSCCVVGWAPVCGRWCFKKWGATGWEAAHTGALKSGFVIQDCTIWSCCVFCWELFEWQMVLQEVGRYRFGGGTYTQVRPCKNSLCSVQFNTNQYVGSE
jgi:hypothetical protein